MSTAPTVRWLGLALLVTLSIIVAQVLNHAPAAAAPPPQVPPAYSAAAGSLAPPAAESVPLRGHDCEIRRLRELVAPPGGRFAVVNGADGSGELAVGLPW